MIHFIIDDILAINSLNFKKRIRMWEEYLYRGIVRNCVTNTSEIKRFLETYLEHGQRILKREMNMKRVTCCRFPQIGANSQQPLITLVENKCVLMQHTSDKIKHVKTRILKLFICAIIMHVMLGNACFNDLFNIFFSIIHVYISKLMTHTLSVRSQQLLPNS